MSVWQHWKTEIFERPVTVMAGDIVVVKDEIVEVINKDGDVVDNTTVATKIISE